MNNILCPDLTANESTIFKNRWHFRKKNEEKNRIQNNVPKGPNNNFSYNFAPTISLPIKNIPIAKTFPLQERSRYKNVPVTKWFPLQTFPLQKRSRYKRSRYKTFPLQTFRNFDSVLSQSHLSTIANDRRTCA